MGLGNRKMEFESGTLPMTQPLTKIAILVFAGTAALAGCARRDATLYYDPPPPPEVLGTKNDIINERQEANAEASKYIVYMHEFELNDYANGENLGGVRLNEAGEEHVNRIAHNLRRGVPFPVVIERSNTSAWPATKFGYAVHYNPRLDFKRREVVVRVLAQMGIPDADQRVVIAPAFAQPYTSREAERAYRGGVSALSRSNFGAAGF